MKYYIPGYINLIRGYIQHFISFVVRCIPYEDMRAGLGIKFSYMDLWCGRMA